MKTATKAMYTVGIVINCIVLALVGILCILYGVAAFNSDTIAKVAQETGKTEAYIKNLALIVFIITLVSFVVEVVVLILAIMINGKVKTQENTVSNHVFMLVIGILSGGLFYILGGIFGLVSVRE